MYYIGALLLNRTLDLVTPRKRFYRLIFVPAICLVDKTLASPSNAYDCAARALTL
jgi:hypothetical protein